MRVGYDLEVAKLGEELDPESLFDLRAATDEITDFETRSDTTEDKIWLEAKFKFKSTDFKRYLSEDARKFIGNVGIRPNDAGNLVFIRVINSLSEKKSPSQSKNPMRESIYGDAKWVYETYFPSKILTTKASKGEVEQTDKSMKWTFQMAELEGKPMFMSTEIEPELNP